MFLLVFDMILFWWVLTFVHSFRSLSKGRFKKNYETYYRSARVQVWTISKYFLSISNNFLGLSLSILVYLVSRSILDYLGLSLSILVYLGLSRTILDYLGLSRSILVYLSLSRTVWDHLGLSGTIRDYMGLSGTIWHYLVLSGTIWHYLGLYGTRVQVEAGESKLLLFETFPFFFYFYFYFSLERFLEELALLKKR